MRLRWIVAALLLVALDAYLLLYRWSDVGGNIEAQFVIITPAFLLQHLALRRHVDRRHAETAQRLDAQDEALAANRAKVADLHQQLAE
jgi:membrane protein implicated in regulation of membrane protease activity